MTLSDKLQNAYVSKSLFLRGLQCYKSLYLDRRRPELRGEISYAQEKLFERGKEVGTYEVKMAAEIKDIYIYDVAVQHYVLKGAGLPISKANLVYINNKYVRNGDIDVDKLFIIEDITEIMEEKEDFV